MSNEICVNNSNIQVQWVEEEDEVFATVVRQLDVLELAIDDSSAIPVRGRFRDWKKQQNNNNNSSHFYWAIQRSWFARVNALCNLSRKKSREVAAHFRADF